MKRVLEDIVRVKEQADRAKADADERKQILEIDLRQIKVARDNFIKEMDQTEKDLRIKLEECEEASRKLATTEREFNQRRVEFEESQKKVLHENETLQWSIEQYNMDRE